MKWHSWITFVIIVAVFGIFVYFVSKIVNPLDFYYKWQDEKRKSDLVQIQQALEKYYAANSEYPVSTGNDVNPCEGDNLLKQRNPNTKEFEPIQWGTNWFGYVEPMPQDSDGSRCYVYAVAPTKQSYWLYASLQRGKKDEHTCGHPGIDCNNMIGNNLQFACHKKGISDASNCNYGLSSANESL